jgi:hypothetical protein
MKSPRILVIACGLLVAATVQAQRPKSASKVVPPNLRPPAGMCRIWLDGVPPGRQPAPTDCASALRNRPAKGQVIFGDDYAHADSDHDADDARGGDQALKGVAPLPKSLESKPSADTTAGGKKAGDTTSKKADDTTGKKADDSTHKKKGGGGRKTGAHRPDSTSAGGSPRLLPPTG